jgi:outer membrane protein assembly factor BamB
VDSEANKVWTKIIGGKQSAGQTVVEVGGLLVVGGGLYQASSGRQQAALVALDPATGSTVWETAISHAGHGSIRGVILSGDALIATGYIGNNESGFKFIADGENARAYAWKFDLNGNLLTTTALGVSGMTQGAKVGTAILKSKLDKGHFSFVPCTGAGRPGAGRVCCRQLSLR